MTDRNEALRLAEPPNIDNLKKIAASDSTTALRNALLASIKWVQHLEQSLKFEQAASFRDQVAELEAERDQLRAELALRPWRPISPARIAALWSEACKPDRPTSDMVEAFVRLIEADHGMDAARTTHRDPA